MILRIATIPFVLFLLLSAPAFASEDPAPTRKESWCTLDTGIAHLEHHDADAKEIISRAAAQLESVMNREDLHTTGMYHALGNAYALLDNYGQAVLAYKRGLEIDPRDRKLKDSLDFVREQVHISVQPDTASRIHAVLLGWRGYVPRGLLWGVFVTLFVLGWVLLILRSALKTPRSVRTAGIWCIGIACVPFAMLGYEWKLTQGSEQIVMTQNNVIAMSGPDDSIYEPAYSEPLDAGVEGVLEETRDGWGFIRLIDGTECWVPQDSYQLVNPPLSTKNG